MLNLVCDSKITVCSNLLGEFLGLANQRIKEECTISY